MSASREKDTRQAKTAFGQAGPKTAHEAQQRKEEKRNNRLYGVIAVVFVIIAIACLVYRSNIIPKMVTAATIGDESYTAAEVNYYFVNNYQNFLSQNYNYISYMGLDVSSDLRDQEYSDGETWFDFFMDQTLQQMAEVQAMNDAAAADGFTWNDDLQAQLDKNMNALETSASNNALSTSGYLKRIFGSTMTEKIFEEQTKRTLLAQAYAQNYEGGLTYTEDQLTEAYNADPKSYDKVSYEVIRISGAADTTDADGNTIEVTDEMTQQAMADAKASADSMYAAWMAGSDPAELVDNDKSVYTTSDAGAWSDSVMMNWLFDDARQAGDSTVLEDADNSYYYVLLFHDRFREDYNTVDVRHILIQPEATTLSKDDEGYDADVQAKKDAAKQKAEDLLAQWKAGDATEDSFAQLANENSTDTGSNTNGGLYTEVYQDQMVEAFNDWCFDAARKPGDTGIVETNYGYHIMYFVGTDLPYWEVQVRDTLKNDDFNTWYTEKTADYTAEQRSFGIRFVRSTFTH